MSHPDLKPTRLMIAGPRRKAWWLALVLLEAFAMFAAPASAGAAGYSTVSGSGSSWSSVAIDQWMEELRSRGVVINYNPDGSAAGRGDYMQGSQVDFAGSDPPFRDGSDKLGGQGAEHPPLGYSYVPITAGGTAFMYHLTVAGHQVTNLRLSGDTIVKIFTGQITNWADPRITHDYGAQLPSEPITPVVRSDGSGATFMFTRWMAHAYASQWDSFCQRVAGVSSPCGQTEFYPGNWGGAKAQNGSNAVAGYISAGYGEGSIGYDEYAYAKNLHYPVVKLLNAAGYYSLPTAANVAVALTRAQIVEDPNRPDFLQQNLDNVYSFGDPRAYPLSSYSYLIVPRDGKPLPPIFNGGKGRTLSTFVQYSLCDGQQDADRLGYSPIPGNLVSGGLLQVSKIPGHIPVSMSNCNNPTIDSHGNLILLRDAPQPSPCDKVGTPLNCVVKNGQAVPGPGGNNGGPGGANGGPGAGNPNGTPGANGTNPNGTGPGGIDPLTGAPTGSGNGSNVLGQAVNAASNAPSATLLSVLTALEVLTAVAAPPALGMWWRRRRAESGDANT